MYTAERVKEFIDEDGVGGFRCRVCLKVYGVWSHTREHFILKHVEGGFQFACPMCNKILMDRKAGKAHLRRNHDLNYRLKDLDPFMKPIS